MGARFVVTPWRDPEELLQVRQDLYSTDGANSIERRQKAVRTILTWRIRKPDLPLLLDSTADVVDAVLQDERGGLEHNALRLVYATALSRFVTGFTDTKSDLNSARPPWIPKPADSDAPFLTIPSFLLETRHSIVHRDLPPLSLSRIAAKQSLDWLWENYWSHLDTAFDINPEMITEPYPGAFKGSLKEILKVHIKRRLSEIKGGRKTIAQIQKYKAGMQRAGHVKYGIAAEIDSASILAHSTTYGLSFVLDALAAVLIDDGFILPAKFKRGDSVLGAFIIWDPLLLAIETSDDGLGNGFLAKLLNHIINFINTPSETRDFGEQDAVKEAMQAWLQHILESPDYAVVHRASDCSLVETVLERCFSEPTTWNLRVAEALIQSDALTELDKPWWQGILESAKDENTMLEADPAHHRAMAGEADEDMDVDSGAEEHGAVAIERKDEGDIQDELQDAQKEKESGEPEKKKWCGPRKNVGLWRPTPIGAWPAGWEGEG